MPDTCVVEGGATLQAKRHLAADNLHSADQLVGRGARARYRHVVFELPHAVGMEKASNKNRGIRPVELLVAEIVAGRGDPEAAPFLVVENRGKNTGRIEAGHAEPVDRAVHSHQRSGAHVADEAIILDGLILWFRHDVFLMALIKQSAGRLCGWWRRR